MTNINSSPIFCAIDKPDIEAALFICKKIKPFNLGIKLGLEFFNALGIQGVLEIEKAYPSVPIFLDLKYHDIPNTVAGAVLAATNKFKPAFLNVHAAGGFEMMETAKVNCPPETKLLAVTILTSLSEEDIIQVGYKENIRDRVVQMAKLAKKAGLDGVVCSSHEIEAIREACGKDFILMVPGIRPEGFAGDDQTRIMSPREAMDKGATHLVIGRPITSAEDKERAAFDLLNSLDNKKIITDEMLKIIALKDNPPI